MSKTDESGRDKALKINSVSKSFCLAKWQQVTIDLVNGTTHSCHHPDRHKIPLSELAGNPSALHNTQFKKEQRKLMLEGVRPPECRYCWEVEDQGSEFSDRIIKSSDPWAYPHLERVSQLPWEADVAPSYLEVMFDDLCNFSCMYCMTEISTGVAQEIQKFGPYSMFTHQFRSSLKPREDRQPYLDAFWKWFPEILPSLRIFRITGGEPLLSPQFDKVLKFLENEGHTDLTLIVNSHLGHATPRIDALIEKIKKLIDLKKIAGFELYTSVDGYGEQAEYIRHGLRYGRLIENIKRVQNALPETRLVLMCTLNILSIASLKKLIQEVALLKRSYPNVSLDCSYLSNPQSLRLTLATPELVEELRQALDWMKENTPEIFSPHELRKLENAVLWTERRDPLESVLRWRTDFFYFIQEYDRRKGRSFLQVFPEYKEFLNTCKQYIFNRAFNRVSATGLYHTWLEKN
jgi:organic radical activating enzyme